MGRNWGKRAIWLAMQASAPFSRRMSGWFAARLWFTPMGTDRVAHDPALVAARPLTITAGEQVCVGYSVGEGPTVLLVHGWGDRASALSPFVTPLVAAGLRVVAVDLPGHGASPSRQTDLYALARAVRAAAGDSDGVRGIIAHSLGALATTLALRDGLHADAVVLVAPAVRLTHALERFAAQLRMHPNAERGLRARIEARFGRAVWEEVAGDRIAAGLTVPALVVHDRRDSQVALADAELLARAWPGARLVVTEGLGHTRILRDPDVAARASAFIAEVARRDPPVRA